MDMIKLAEEIKEGRRLLRGEDVSYFKTCGLEELRNGADLLRRHFSGDTVDLCTIISGKNGNCGENWM